MYTLQISLPEETIEIIRTRVAQRGYRDAGEYIHELVISDNSWDEMEKMVLEGVQSGSEPLTESDWDTIRAEVRRRTGNVTMER
jgi:Arc/MetJ-type ribon-helix-helix transcriptional regulator